MPRIADMFAAALTARGETEVAGRSRKFRTFTRNAAQHAATFVAQSGSKQTLAQACGYFHGLNEHNYIP